MTSQRTVYQANLIDGAIDGSPDKSISHRALILGAAAEGTQEIKGLSDAADIGSTIGCLRAMGCTLERLPGGMSALRKTKSLHGAVMNAGNSGTTARLLAGLAAGLAIPCSIDGDSSLRARPMKRIAEPLAKMGALISTSDGGTLPLRIEAGPLHGIRYELPVASAQVKSAILIAALFANGETTVVEPVRTRDHTERMLTEMGVEVRRRGNEITISGPARPRATRIRVAGDFSAAAYFITAAVCIPDSRVRIDGVNVNPTRTGFLEAVRRMGANVVLENERVVSGEPVADIIASHSQLRGIDIDDPETVASMIDELPIFAILATRARGESKVSGAAELRRKESDRIRTIVEGLHALGAGIEEHPDGFTVMGNSFMRGTRVSSYGDHRIAMSMAVAGLIASGRTFIDDADVVEISYPSFFEDLEAVSHRTEPL